MFRTNPGCGCCGPACEIATDNFNRDDGPPSGWTELAGTDWEIESNELTTGTSAAIIRNDNAHPDGEFSMKATAKVKGENEGDRLRVFVSLEDADDWLCAEVEFGDTCGVLRLFECVGGSESQLGADIATQPITTSTAATLHVCFRDSGSSDTLGGGILWAKVVTADGRTTFFAEQNATGIGEYGGVGCGSLTTQASFDDFTLDKGYSEGLNPDCDPCRECSVGTDDFDDSSIDCRWNEVAGSWSESSGSISSSGAGQLRWKVPADGEDWTYE